MKSFFLLVCCFVSNSYFAQGIVSQPDKKVLYRGYANVIVIGLNGTDKVFVSGKNCTVKAAGVNKYLISPTKASTATLIVLNSSKDTIANETYKVVPLPPLQLAWGDQFSGAEVLDRSSNNLSLSFGTDVPIQVSQSIVSYTLKVSGNSKVIKGNGNILTPEGRQLIQDAVAGQLLSITATYKNTAQEVKTVSATFSLQ